MAKTNPSRGPGSRSSRYKPSAEAKAASFVSFSSSAPASAAKVTTFTQEPPVPRNHNRPPSWQIRNLDLSTATQDPKQKTETFRDQSTETPAGPTPPPTPPPRRREVEQVPAPAPPPASTPTARTSLSPIPNNAQPQPAELLGDRPIPLRQREYVTRPSTPRADGAAPRDNPQVRRTATHQPEPIPLGMTPIPEEPGDHMDELKVGLQALLGRMEVMKREAQESTALAEKEHEIETLHAYIASLEARHKRGKELLTNREIQVLQLEGQLAAERSSAAYFKNELASYDDERAELEEKLKKEKQSVLRLEEERRLSNELLHESENSNNLLYDELEASEVENDGLVKQLTEANTVINRLRDEKAEDAFFIQATHKWLADSEAQNKLLQMNAEVPQSEAVDEKKKAELEERYEKERDQWADIFDTQRIQISQFEDKMMALQDEIERLQSEKAKHIETENVNQMLRTRVIFLQFQRVTLTKKTTNIECQLSTAQKAAIETQDRLNMLQKAYDESKKLSLVMRGSKSTAQSLHRSEQNGHEDFL